MDPWELNDIVIQPIFSLKTSELLKHITVTQVSLVVVMLLLLSRLIIRKDVVFDE